MKINFTKTCKNNGITQFSRTRGGWMKLVEGYDTTKYGGYRFIGDNFVKVGNFETDLTNGLYLDCSKHYNKEDEHVVEIMNLFDVKDGNVTLLNTIPKVTKGWANKFEGTVEDYFKTNEVTTEEIIEQIRNMTCNRETLQEVGRTLLKEEMGKSWLNLAHFSAFMRDACVYRANHALHDEEVQKMAVELFQKSYEAERYFNYEISNDHQCRSLYSLIHTKAGLKKYANFKVIFENISEDYYLNLEHLKELREYNYNEITRGAIHDRAYWVSFDSGVYATEGVIYIIVPNLAHETLKIQRMKIHY